MSKALVSYFSVSGVTSKAAKDLCMAVNGDLCEIVPAVPYSAADLDYMNENSRCSVEMKDPASRPELACSQVSAADYDVVYVGFPIWWGVAPHAVNAFLEKLDLAGKKVIAFATSAQSGMDAVAEALAPSVKGAELVVGCIVKGTEEIEALSKLA